MWKLCAAEHHQMNGGVAGVDYDPDSNDDANPQHRHYGTKKKNLVPDDILACMMACRGAPPQDISRGSGSDGRLSGFEDYDPLRSNKRTEGNKDDDIGNHRGRKHKQKHANQSWRALLLSPSNLEHVQESAQDVFERGHAMVGGIVGQVQDVVSNTASSSSSSDPGGLHQLLEVGNRISCTPQAEDLFCKEFGEDDIAEEGSSYNKNNNTELYEDTFNDESRIKAGRSSEKLLHREERYEEDRHRRRRSHEGRRKSSHRRSSSRSKRR